ncbi:MAG: histidine phosphatase family protein, partial [Acidimicrobiales bacterium]
EQRWPGLIDAWRARRIERTPGAEGAEVFVARALAAVTRVASLVPHGGVAVAVTHGGTIRSLEHQLSAEPGHVSNLCGRWLEVADGTVTAGPAVVVPGLVPAHEPVPADVRD